MAPAIRTSTKLQTAGQMPLLGRLAERSSIRKSGEVTATAALEILLDYQPLRTAFLDYVTKETGINTDDVAFFRTEHVKENLNRTDLEGCDADARPIVVIEAKFWAALTEEQLNAYLQEQSRDILARLNGSDLPNRGFAVLVPQLRKAEARTKLKRLEANWDTEPHQTGLGVITWEGISEAFRAAIGSVGQSFAMASDAAQFTAMCTALCGAEPSTTLDEGHPWYELRHDIEALLDEVTRILSIGGHLYPMVPSSGRCGPLRYVHGGRPGAYLSVGVVPSFADSRQTTPLWVRYERTTPGFEQVCAAIAETSLQSKVTDSGGQLWLPLEIRGHSLTDPDVVNDLVRQVEEIQAAAAIGWETGFSADTTYVEHTVRKGDTLSKLAQKYYSKGNEWAPIFEANLDQIEHPDIIYPGQVLRIPQ